MGGAVTPRFFWLTLPSGHRLLVKAYTCAELVDVLCAHFERRGHLDAFRAWHPEQVLIPAPSRLITEVMA